MQYIVFDTSAIIHILRDDAKGKEIRRVVRTEYPDGTFVISSVTKGELLSFTLQLHWGIEKMKKVIQYLESVSPFDVKFKNEDLHNAYTEIDCFSKGKGQDKNGKNKGGSAITMGKNDLWIAATTTILDAVLISTDKDFEHLDKKFFTLRMF